MKNNEELTKEDYILAKTKEEYFNKVFKYNYYLITKISNVYAKQQKLVYELQAPLTDALVKAIKSYDPDSPAKFSSFATRCLINSVHSYFRDKANNKDVLNSSNLCSLDDVILTNSNNKSITIQDGLKSDSYDKQEEYIRSYTPSSIKLLTFLNEKEKRIVHFLYKGFNQSQTAQLLNVSRESVNQYTIRIKSKLNKILKICKDVEYLQSKGYNIVEITNKLNLNSYKVAQYYKSIHDYLFYNGARPEDNKSFLSNPYKTANKEKENPNQKIK